MRRNSPLSLACAVVAAVVAVGAVQAADYNLICQNPGREYNLTFSFGDAAVLIDPDTSAIRQPVLAVIDSDAMRLVVLDIAQSGMISVLHLRPYLKNDIFADGQLVQTDACHEVDP